MKDLRHLSLSSDREDLSPNSEELVQQLRLHKGDIEKLRITDQVDMTVPIDASLKFLYTTKHYLLDSEEFPYQIHMLPDAMLVRVYFNRNDAQTEIDKLDMMTSKAIKLGGVVDSNKKSSLDTISPFLIQRMLGVQGLEIQRSLKKSFDPNNVLQPDWLIPTTEMDRLKTNPFLWLQMRNKHVYYFTTL